MYFVKVEIAKVIFADGLVKCILSNYMLMTSDERRAYTFCKT